MALDPKSELTQRPAEMALDSKSELTQFLQGCIGRALTKQDVVYTTEAHGELFQSTVRLVCKEGEEWAGELRSRQKDAMQSAAAEALKFFAAEIAALPQKPAKAKKERPAAAEPTSKTELAQKLQAHCKRPMTKADVVYAVARTPPGFQATVQLLCIGGLEFTGEDCIGEKQAQQSAAQQALMNCHMWSARTGAKVQTAQKAPEPTGASPKSELTELLMRHLRRALTKADILYAVMRTTCGGFQATVDLLCHQSQRFAGEVCESPKLAEASAAHQALLSVSSELGEPPPAALLSVSSELGEPPPAKSASGAI